MQAPCEQLPLRRRDFSAAQLKLMRSGVARNCSDAEFDEFVAVAMQAGLDPLRRQLAPLIVNAEDPARRRLIPWATIDGLRVIAARQGDYRPMESASVIERDDASVDPSLNPLGLVHAEVCVWKGREGEWRPVTGEAWWDEHAPSREEWGPNDRGEREPTGRRILEQSWARMGRLMLAKCAEAQALRRGWPDVLSGLYGEEELHALNRADKTASERLTNRQSDTDQLRTPATDALWLVFDPAIGLVSVPRSEVANRIGTFYSGALCAATIRDFQARNQQSLRIFWDWAPGAAWSLKNAAETRAEGLDSKLLLAGKSTRAKRPRAASKRSLDTTGAS